MRRKGGEVVLKLVTISILSALGFVLMAFVRLPYPIAPWLMIELSEVTVLIAYAAYGFWASFSVAIIKTALDMTIHGPTLGLGIGNITALFASLMFVFSLFICSRILKLFNKGFKHRLIGYGVITLFVSVSLTLLNAIVSTPSYLTAYGSNPHYSTCFEPGAIENVIRYFHDQEVMIGIESYFGIIALIYIPFNLLKAGLDCLVYELLFNRLVYVLIQRSKTAKKYFFGTAIKNENCEKTEDETQIEQ